MEIPKDPTIRDVMLFMQQGFANVDTKFVSVHTRMDSIEEQGDVMQESVQTLATQMNERFDAAQEATQGLATHMDERFDALMPGVASKDFVERKAEAQSTKTHILVNILKTKNVLTPQEATDVIRA